MRAKRRPSGLDMRAESHGTTSRKGWVGALALACTLAACGADEGSEGAGGSDAIADAAAGDTGATADGTATSDDATTDDGGPADSAAKSDDAAGSPDAAAAHTCDDDKACDDKLSCTQDSCTAGASGGAKACSWSLKPDFCLIGKVCYAKGAAHPTLPCKVCDPAASTSGWSQAAPDAPCEDGVTCTVDGACDAAGVCKGKPLTCDDGNPCTDDVCQQGQGCVYPPKPGDCSDDDACTKDDVCVEGTCLGDAVSCDDDNPCTQDSCDPKTAGQDGTGCAHSNTADPCDDGDACTADDTCAEGVCKATGATNCDDGNACTLDVCKPAAGCAHLPTQSPCCTGQTSICDDGNPCTTDLCDPKTGGCSKKQNTAVCDDGDACTSKDTCAKGACAGKVSDCDDKNACTTDACDKSKGCVHAATNAGKPCDDGDVCSKNDTCQSGKCVGTGGCACTPKFSQVAAKVTDIKVGKGGQPGEGLDLDGNAKTCAPSSSCTGGIDNALGALAGLVNGQLDKPVQDGSILVLVELIDFKQGPVKAAVHLGTVDPSNKTCDFQKQTCKYLAAQSLLDPVTCASKAVLSGKLVGTKLTVGAKGEGFPVGLPLQDGVNLNLMLYDLQLVGTVVTSGGKLTSMTGILGAAVLKADLEKAIDALPNEGLPVPKATIKALLASTVEVDVDVDGDGKKEASSIALKIKAIPAVLSGAK